MSKMNFNLPPWLSIIIAILILCATIAIGYLIDRFNIVHVLSAIGLVVVAATVGVIMASLTASQRLTEAEENLQKKSSTLEEHIIKVQDETQKILAKSKMCQDCINSLEISVETVKQIIQGKLGEFILTHDDLVQIEDSIPEREEIWVLTSALELEDNELKEVIRKNFGKKIKYKYLIPKRKDLIYKMIFLAQQWRRDCNLSVEDAKELIECYLIPEHLVYMTVVIYNPNSSKPNVQPIVLVKFSTSEYYKKEDYPFILQVNPKQVGAWNFYIESLKKMMHTSERLPIDFSKELKKER